MIRAVKLDRNLIERLIWHPVARDTFSGGKALGSVSSSINSSCLLGDSAGQIYLYECIITVLYLSLGGFRMPTDRRAEALG